MSGFPGRPSRSAFGPTRQDDGVVTDPERYVSAADFNLTFAQVSGMGVVSPRAWALLVWDPGGPSLTVSAAAEAWDPNGLSAPTVTRSSDGEYVLTYASSYDDHTGTPVSTGLVAGDATPQVVASPYSAASVPRANGYEVDVRVWDANNIASDGNVLVVLW